jgi:uncharacterized protein YegL
MKTKHIKKKDKNMDKKMKTYVALVLDQSGSMSATKEDAVKGYNEQIQQMKINAKDQEIFCSLVTFNGDVFEHLWCEPAEKLTEASGDDYKCEGSTAMRDAVGYTIDKLRKTTDDKEDVAYLVIIVSDGDENASKHFSVEALRELKDSVDKTGKWTFTYMGCDEKYLKKVAQEMNIPISNVARWSNSSAELAGFGQHQNAVKMGGYYRNRAKGMTAQACVHSGDALKMADYTEAAPDHVDAEDAVNAALKGLIVQGGPSHLFQPQPLPLHTNVNMNVLDDGHKVVCDGSSSPFKNYSPVTWKA